MVNKAGLTNEILKYAVPLEKGRALDPADEVGCAKLILKLENERRRLAMIAQSADAVIDGREQDWKELIGNLQRDNTALRSLIKDMVKSMKPQAKRQDDNADKWLKAAETFKSSNRVLRLPK